MKNFHFNILQFNVLSWPVILLVIGILILANHKDSFFGLLLIVIGGVGIVSKYMHISFRSFLYEYWPFLLIIFGIYTILISFSEKRGNGTVTIEEEEYFLDIFSIFGDMTKIVKVNNLLGGKITSLFSELKLDMRESKFLKNSIELDSVTLFGSTKIYIPDDLEVIIKTTTIFGGFEDNRRKLTKESEGKVLIIKGLVLFGGGEIKS